MYDRARELDLRRHLNLAVEHIFNTLDERQDYLPFFHYELIQQPTRLQHGPFDSPHVVGRFLDALGCCAAIIDLPEAPAVYDALARQGLEVVERVAIPDELIPDDASVEMDAKKAAGYFSERPVGVEELKQPKGRGLDD